MRSSKYLARKLRFVFDISTVLTVTAIVSLPATVSAFNYNVGTLTPNIVVHPGGYAGTGGEIEIVVGIDADSPFAQAMGVSVQNAVRRWNALEVTTNNFIEHDAANLRDDQFDFESVLLHEMGHALGLDHVNLDADSGFGAAELRYARSAPGPNGRYDLGPGADGKGGTRDDQRSDDVNLNFFSRRSNNPFVLPQIVDRTTYSTDLRELPAGDSFATFANPDSSKQYGHKTMALMMQGSFAGSTRRTLSADDVAAIRYAASGLDETANTSDDYRLRFRYRGLIEAADLYKEQVHILVTMQAPFETSFANTAPAGFSIPGTTHVRITKAIIGFNKDINWNFNSAQTNIWQNPVLPLDVNQDGVVAPQDVLYIFNTLNALGPRKLTGTHDRRYYDVNGDGFVSPSDGLVVINFLNRNDNTSSGEGESSAKFAGTASIGGAELAVWLDTNYGLNCPSWLKNSLAYYSKAPWNTDNAKFILGTNYAWYYITKSGALHRWSGDFSGSPFVAQLNPDYYRIPALLYDAAQLGRAF